MRARRAPAAHVVLEGEYPDEVPSFCPLVLRLGPSGRHPAIRRFIWFAFSDIRKRSRRDQNDFQFNAFTCGHLSVFLLGFPASFKCKNFTGCILGEIQT